MTSCLIFRASSLLNSPLLPPPLVYHNSLQSLLSCTQCPHNLFTARWCILHSVLYSLLHLTWQPGSCSRHRYNKTTAVTMPVLVSCVAWALPPTLTITITSPLQQDCKHSQQTLSVVISAELLLAGRRTDNTITFMSSLWTTSLLNQFSSSFFPAGLSLVIELMFTKAGRPQCTVGQSPKGMVYFLELAIAQWAKSGFFV